MAKRQKMNWKILLPMVLLISVVSAEAHPTLRTLRFLPNGHVQFDTGPELDQRQLTIEIKRMTLEHDCPNVHVSPDKDTSYARVASVLRLFQQFGCNDLGYRGTEKLN